MGFRPDEINAEVDRVLQSKIFETSKVHRNLLRYLTDKSVAGEADGLKEYTIGLQAFGKPASYDPKTDSIVRLQVTRLRQKLTEYYSTDGCGDPVVVQLPKGGFKLSSSPVRLAQLL